MNTTKVRDQWIEALLSGKYIQGTGLLKQQVYNEAKDKDVDSHCCLGVLCEILGTDEPDYGTFFYDGNPMESIPTHKFWEDLGFSKYTDDDGCDILTMDHLAEMNDSGASFREIAEWIKENL